MPGDAFYQKHVQDILTAATAEEEERPTTADDTPRRSTVSRPTTAGDDYFYKKHQSLITGVKNRPTVEDEIQRIITEKEDRPTTADTFQRRLTVEEDRPTVAERSESEEEDRPTSIWDDLETYMNTPRTENGRLIKPKPIIKPKPKAQQTIQTIPSEEEARPTVAEEIERIITGDEDRPTESDEVERIITEEENSPTLADDFQRRLTVEEDLPTSADDIELTLAEEEEDGPTVADDIEVSEQEVIPKSIWDDIEDYLNAPRPVPEDAEIQPRRWNQEIEELERKMAESESDESEFNYGEYDPYDYNATPKMAFQTPNGAQPFYENGEDVNEFKFGDGIIITNQPTEVVDRFREEYFPAATPWAGEGALKRYGDYWENAADFPLMYANHRDEEVEDMRHPLRILFGHEEARERFFPEHRPIGPQRKDVMKYKVDDVLNEDMEDVMHEMISNHYRYGVDLKHDLIKEPSKYNEGKYEFVKKPLKPGLGEFVKNKQGEYLKNFYKKHPLYEYPEVPEDFYDEEVRRTESEENARIAQQAFESTKSMQEPSRLPGTLALNHASGRQSLARPGKQFTGTGKHKARGDASLSPVVFDGPRSEFSESKGGKIKIITDRMFSYGGLGDCVITGTLFAETADVSPAFKSIVGVIDRKQDQVDTSYEELHVLELEVGSLRQQLTEFVQESDFDQDAFAAEEKELQAKLEKAKKSLNELNDGMEIGYVSGFKEDYGTPEKLIAELEDLMMEQENDLPDLEEELKKLSDAKDIIETQTNQLSNQVENKMKINKQADRQFNTLRCKKEALEDKCEEIQGSAAAAYEAYQELYYTLDELMQDNSVLVNINKKLAKKITFLEDPQIHSYIQEVIIDPDCTREEYNQIFKKKHEAIVEAGEAKRAELQEIVKAAQQSPLVKGERPAPEARSKTKSNLISRMTALRKAEAKKAKAKLETKTTLSKKTYSKSGNWK